MVTIRKGTIADMDAIMALLESIFEGEQDIPHQLHAVPESQKPEWWCADLDGRVVGTVALYLMEDGHWHMGRFVLSGNLRGQHVATRLLYAAMDDVFSPERDIDIIYTESRDATVHILEKMGGIIVGEPREFYKGAVTPVNLRKEDYLRNRAAGPVPENKSIS